ncbi:nuclear fragile X mental retardation protein interacting protein 1 [Dinochytrium kinnereticum]|nr:nuclear fragile X mental retardation protein interacting protein 1 [Dinochytrium kinnereticum]
MSDIRPPPGGYAPPPPPDRDTARRSKGGGGQASRTFRSTVQYSSPTYGSGAVNAYAQQYPQQAYGFNAYPNVYFNAYAQQPWPQTLHYNLHTGFTAGHPHVPSTPTQPSKPKPTFSCDACEQQFKNLTKYEEHVAGHQKCAECDFVASKKVLAIHVDEAHAPGLVIKKVEDPEEIARWIAERKRNYPTDANIAKRKAEEEDRADIGMLPNERNKKKRKAKAPPTPSGDPVNGKGLVDTYHTSTDDSDVDSEDAPEPEPTKPPAARNGRPKSVCRFFARGKCRQGNKCKFLHQKDPVENAVKAPGPRASQSHAALGKRQNLLRQANTR